MTLLKKIRMEKNRI